MKKIIYEGRDKSCYSEGQFINLMNSELQAKMIFGGFIPDKQVWKMDDVLVCYKNNFEIHSAKVIFFGSLENITKAETKINDQIKSIVNWWNACYGQNYQFYIKD